MDKCVMRINLTFKRATMAKHKSDMRLPKNLARLYKQYFTALSLFLACWRYSFLLRICQTWDLNRRLGSPTWIASCILFEALPTKYVTYAIFLAIFLKIFPFFLQNIKWEILWHCTNASYNKDIDAACLIIFGLNH